MYLFVFLYIYCVLYFFFFFQAEDGIREYKVTGVQTCALPICDEEPGHAWSHDARAVEDHGVESDGVGQVGLPYEIAEEGLAGGDVDGAPHPVDRGEDGHVPVADVAAPHEQREHEGLCHQGRLGDEKDAPLAQAIAQRAAHRGEKEDGRELERVHEPELEGRARQLQHEPRLPHALHPGADERDELPAPEESEVAVPERAQAPGPGRRCRWIGHVSPTLHDLGRPEPDMDVMVERLRDRPSGAIGELLAESEGAGLRLVRRLVDDWESGANRFDGEGEMLLGAWSDGRLVGVGGLTVDPYGGSARTGRVRHLYVLGALRRGGIGRRLVLDMVGAARGRFDDLRLRTNNPAAARLYEGLGFR